MGRSQSKFLEPNNPMEKLEHKRRREILEKEKQRKRISKLRKKMQRGHKIQQNSQIEDKSTNRTNGLNPLDYEQIATQTLRRQFSNDLSHFLLNQLMLSVQFFGNFEREKLEAIERNLDHEKEKNQKLLKHSIIMPNVIDDAAKQRIIYRPRHGPHKDERSDLHTTAMFVVHENIEILRPEDTNYASISPTCKLVLDSEYIREENWKGYVRLKLWEMLKNGEVKRRERRKRWAEKIQMRKGNEEAMPRSSHSNSSSSDEEDFVEEEIYNDAAVMSSENGDNPQIRNTTKGKPRRSATSSSTYHSGSDYDYAYITSLNIHQPLSQLTSAEYISSDTNTTALPSCCISELPIESDNKSSDSDELSDESDKFVPEVKYLNSKSFLCYFANVFKYKLGHELGIPDHEITSATWRGASIFTLNLEIIPAIFSPWPNCAFEWQRRVRPVHENPLTRQKFEWPDEAMINRVVSFGCHVIPMGYAPKIGKNPYRDLEWKIVFPKAERYLETCLTNTQVKVFMIAKTLIKTFVEPQQDKDTYMFTFDHLRTHLFWQVESNFGAWPEEYLGDALIRFLKTFLNRLSMKVLPDYFLPERNLFESIPNKAKAELHEIINQIVHNPVMHIMMAYRNLEKIGKFCPTLNYKKIYSAVVVENPLLLIDRISESRKGFDLETLVVSTRNTDDEDDSEDETEKQKGLIGYSQKKEKFDESKRRRTERLKSKEKERIKRKLENCRRESLESIDLQFIIPETFDKIKRQTNQNKAHIRQRMDGIRKNHIANTFTNYFISVANSLQSFKSFDLSLIYLMQASRLCTLLEDEKVKATQTSIELLLTKVRKLAQTETETGPKLPRRISMEPSKKLARSQSMDSNEEDVEKLERRPPRPQSFTPSFTNTLESVKENQHKNVAKASRKSVQFSVGKKGEILVTQAQVHSRPKKVPAISGRLHGIMKQSSLDETSSNASSPDGNFQGFKPYDFEQDDDEINITDFEPIRFVSKSAQETAENQFADKKMEKNHSQIFEGHDDEESSTEL